VHPNITDNIVSEDELLPEDTDALNTSGSEESNDGGVFQAPAEPQALMITVSMLIY
jgi:hypothetical protein